MPEGEPQPSQENEAGQNPSDQEKLKEIWGHIKASEAASRKAEALERGETVDNSEEIRQGIANQEGEISEEGLSPEQKALLEREVFNLEKQIGPEAKALLERKEPEMRIGLFGRLARNKAAFIAASFLALYAARAESQQLPPSVWGQDTVVYEPSGRPSSTAGRSSGGLFESGDVTACGAGILGSMINGAAGQRNPARPIEECIKASVRNRQTYERSRQVIVREEARRLEQERRSQERERVAEIRAAERTGTYIPPRGGSVETEETARGARSSVRPGNEGEAEEREYGEYSTYWREKAGQDWQGKTPMPDGVFGSLPRSAKEAYGSTWNNLERNADPAQQTGKIYTRR